MDLGLEGKVIIVTGGSKGIGPACARAFLAEGDRVAIVSRNPANLESARRVLSASKSDLIAVFCQSLSNQQSDREGGYFATSARTIRAI